MPGLSKKETEKLLTHVEAQGVKVTPVKNGFMLRLPNGESTTVHLSVSDHRGPANMRAFLKRNGIDWPTDKVKNQKLSKGSLDKGDALILALDFPAAITNKHLRHTASDMGWNPTADVLGRYMRIAGYEAIGRTAGIIWKKPMPIIEEVKKEVVTVEKQEVVTDTGNVYLSREFLDTHDSWTVDLAMMPQNVTLSDMQMMFKATGLSFEIRVWR